MDVEQAARSGFLHTRDMGDEWGIVGIMPFIYTVAIVAEIHEYGYVHRWCYHSYEAAQEAYNNWNGEGEPEGWHRHTPSCRRRENGDKTKEYITP